MSTKEKSRTSAIFVIIGLLTAAMIISFFLADEPTFSWLRHKPVKLNDNILETAFEQLGKVYAVVWLLLFWVWITGKHKTVLTALLAMIITIPGVWSIKAAVQRPRPSAVIKAEAEIENNHISAKNWSFPSGDTASVFAAGTVLAVFAGWPGIIGITICCGIVGVLRVLDLAHYPSDVFAGAALGIFCGWAALRITSKNPKIENILAGREQMVSFVGIFSIPILSWFFQGPDKLNILLTFYAPAAAIVFFVGWKQKLLCKIEQTYIEQMRRQGAWFVRWRAYLLLIILPIFLIELCRFSYPQDNHLLDQMWELLCLAISLAGLGMRVYTVGYSGPGTVENTENKTQTSELNVTGMYSIVRHPLYLANFIILTGMVLLVRSISLTTFCFLALFIYYERMIIDKEALLLEKHGKEFTEWAMKTPMLIPRIKLWQKPAQHFCRQAVLKGEYLWFFAIIVSFTAIEVFGDRIYEGKWAIDRLWAIIFCFGLLTVAIIAVLKKTGIFRKSQNQSN